MRHLLIVPVATRRSRSRSGEVDPMLFALGPATRGAFWEVTAIPDIRVKAAEVAKAVLVALKDKPHTVSQITPLL